MAEAALKRKFNVEIFRPDEGTPTSITVFLPGTMLNLKDFSETYKAIVDQNQIVIAFKSMNPFPIVGRSHQRMAEDVASVVKEFLAIEENSGLPTKYNIVGHSLGGKVCLMVAAKYDIEHVNKIIALDPVDENPSELTAPNPSPKTNLGNSMAAEIHLFQSEKGGEGLIPMAPAESNASVVNEMYPDQITSFEINAGAEHMSYLDDRGDDASVATREVVRAKIREVIN
jgi:pimeloyl-ACP methyl ester carboxylesterase